MRIKTKKETWTDYSGIENPPHILTVKINLNQSITDKFRGILAKLFPELKSVTDKELESLS